MLSECRQPLPTRCVNGTIPRRRSPRVITAAGTFGSPGISPSIFSTLLSSFLLSSSCSPVERLFRVTTLQPSFFSGSSALVVADISNCFVVFGSRHGHGWTPDATTPRRQNPERSFLGVGRTAGVYFLQYHIWFTRSTGYSERGGGVRARVLVQQSLKAVLSGIQKG